jgi:hypothetical protein
VRRCWVSEIDALRSLEKSGKVRAELVRKILYDNPARFYGINKQVAGVS